MRGTCGGVAVALILSLTPASASGWTENQYNNEGVVVVNTEIPPSRGLKNTCTAMLAAYESSYQDIYADDPDVLVISNEEPRSQTPQSDPAEYIPVPTLDIIPVTPTPARERFPSRSSGNRVPKKPLPN